MGKRMAKQNLRLCQSYRACQQNVSTHIQLCMESVMVLLFLAKSIHKE